MNCLMLLVEWHCLSAKTLQSWRANSPCLICSIVQSGEIGLSENRTPKSTGLSSFTKKPIILIMKNVLSLFSDTPKSPKSSWQCPNTSERCERWKLPSLHVHAVHANNPNILYSQWYAQKFRARCTWRLHLRCRQQLRLDLSGCKVARQNGWILPRMSRGKMEAPIFSLKLAVFLDSSWLCIWFSIEMLLNSGKMVR